MPYGIIFLIYVFSITLENHNIFVNVSSCYVCAKSTFISRKRFRIDMGLSVVMSEGEVQVLMEPCAACRPVEIDCMRC